MATNWTFANGGLAQGDVGAAPTYDDVLYNFLGQTYFRPGMYDAALATTLNAGGSDKGALMSGLDAFLQRGQDEGGTDPLSQAAASGYRSQDLKDLAAQFGIDPNSPDLEQKLRDRTQNYYAIGGMSAGWNPTGDARQGNYTLYERRDGKLVPVQTQAGHIKEEGSWLEEHPGILAPLGVAGAGLLSAYLGAGAAGGGGGAAAGGGGGITGTAGASSAAAYGSLPTSWSGFAGSTGFGLPSVGAGYGGAGLAAAGGGGFASGLSDWYNSLPKYQQQALRGAGQNFVTSGGDPKAALRGGITGGVGGLAGGALNSLGAPDWLSSAGARLAGGLAGGLIPGSGQAPAGSSGGGVGGSSGSGVESLLGPATPGPAASGMAGGVGSNPMGVGLANDVRQQLLARELATTKRAGDAVNDNPLIRALRSA